MQGCTYSFKILTNCHPTVTLTLIPDVLKTFNFQPIHHIGADELMLIYSSPLSNCNPLKEKVQPVSEQLILKLFFKSFVFICNNHKEPKTEEPKTCYNSESRLMSLLWNSSWYF